MNRTFEFVFKGRNLFPIKFARENEFLIGMVEVKLGTTLQEVHCVVILKLWKRP